MYPTNDPWTVKRAIVTARDLIQMLKGYGTPPVDRYAEVDGEKLSDALTALRRVVDEFLDNEA
jgi:hypothetical protein